MSSNTKLYAVALLALAVGDGLAAGQGPVPRALALLASHGTQARTSADDRFLARDVVVDPDGTEHVRFDRTYEGLPVIGGDVVMHSREGRFEAMSLTQEVPLGLSTRPRLQADDAVVAAGTEFGSGFSAPPETALVVDARGDAPRLAWRVRLQDNWDDMTYLVDARSGAILDRWSNRETAAAQGTARTLYAGNVTLTTDAVSGGYELRDPTRGGMRTIDGSNSRTSGQVYKDADNAWGNGAASDKATAAADAQYGAQVTWDYYRNTHGRLGIANDGKGAYSRVHYGRAYANAYWNDGCFCMTYGDGDGVHQTSLVALDITGHEMSHGVTSRTAALVYSGESGGLNEASSDILGTMVEFSAKNGKDAPDYLIGEEVFVDNVAGSPDQRALRYMFDPERDGRSVGCYYPGIGSLDVHYSSGVANHFYYLLAEGTGSKTFNGVDHTPTTCNGATFAGLGRTKAEKIWYRALTVYFTSGTDYAGARAATIQAAKDLYGAKSPESRRVATAWAAVQVN
jgi:Zn-dependent metalloprotease